jgi:hypothetical protein
MAKKLPNNKKDVKLKTSEKNTEKGAENTTNKNLPKTNQKLNPLAKKLQKVIQKTDKPKIQATKEKEAEKVEENVNTDEKKDKKKKKDTTPKYDISPFGYPVFDTLPLKVDYTPKEGGEPNPDKEVGWTLQNNYFYLLEEAAKREMESEEFKKYTPKMTLKDLKRNRSIESGNHLNTVLARMLKFQKKGIIGTFNLYDTLIVGRIAIAFFRKNNFDESLVEKFMENDLEVNAYKDDGIKMVDRQILFYACKFKMMITPRLRTQTARYNHQQEMLKEHPSFIKIIKPEDIIPAPKPPKGKKPKPVKKIKQQPPPPNPNKIKKPKFQPKPKEIQDPATFKVNRKRYDDVKPNFDIKPKYMLDPITRQLVRIEDVIQNQNNTENKTNEPKNEQATTQKIENITPKIETNEQKIAPPITKKDVENTNIANNENTNNQNTNTETTDQEDGEEGKTRRRRVIIRKKP